jgi:hypothetical protein
MTNTILTPTAVTREALRVLHQKLTFLGSVNRQYDSSFAQSGAKIGDSLKIRLPNQYSVRTGVNMSAQDTTESSVTLQVATMKGVDLNFTSQDLTMSLDDFSKRILEPAMSVLASAVEADALQTMIKTVYQSTDNSAISLDQILDARRRLGDALAPEENRTMLLSPKDMVGAVSAMKTYFNDSKELSAQYRKGYMGYAAGFDFAESTHLAKQARGAGASYQTDAATAQTGSTLVVDTGTGIIDVGSVITIDGVYRVHPETKVSTSELMRFVVTASGAGTVTSITISPAIVASGAYQNVSNAAANNKAITILGTANTDYGQGLAFHKDAFTFATADLVLPKGVDFAAREVMDGISMSLVRDFNISDRTLPARLDILYGFKAIRPELACRVATA